jgi:dihydrofolate synthase / folylpolyglutamate synthase
MTEPHLQAALDYIYSFVDYETQRRPRDAASYDLRRMDEILGRLGDPHLKVKSIHIAGSKGKGSTSVMIASALTSSGYKTGLFTSPHLLNFNERIQIDGHEIPDADVVRLVELIKPHVAEINRAATYGKLTTFEIITAMGFVYFAEQKTDFNVVEVGLGGRLDATNVVQPEVCAITSLSLEHTDVLGNTLAEIAGEKAGIIKAGKPVVSAPQQDEAAKVIERVCSERKARLIRVGHDVTWEGHGFESARQSLKVNGRLGSYHLTIPLVGEFQLENTAVAVGCLECLIEGGAHVNARTMARGLGNVVWPGRLQILKRNPYLVVDGAHNPYSAARLADALKKYFAYERATLIIGTSSDKDIAGIVSELKPIFDRVIVTKSIHPRALDPSRLVEEFARQGVRAEATSDISVALPMALDTCSEHDLVCVTGSLYVVAGAIEQCGAPGLRPRT